MFNNARTYLILYDYKCWRLLSAVSFAKPYSSLSAVDVLSAKISLASNVPDSQLL